ncbi:hypothetical protein Adu01nite_29370 [Paractinoplanes durhamensis]|uniref:Uncharacterized protein n=1 Tax=Paractinoplanes durhamensis TaxID=113563 RepID=A0ABQ3YVH5_9ACTN|nr:hypothetical protein Adu01nite_29370 [Actinoplanes durhamensis]
MLSEGWSDQAAATMSAIVAGRALPDHAAAHMAGDDRLGGRPYLRGLIVDIEATGDKPEPTEPSATS